MYNLIVTSREGAWDGNPYRLELGRFGEYTDEAIVAKYKSLDQIAIAELQSLPTLFAYEHGHNADAKVGFIQRVTSRSGQVQIDYAFYPDLPAIPASQLAALAWELDVAKYEMNRSHWAVKAVDLLSTLLEAGLVTNDQLRRLPEPLAIRRFTSSQGSSCAVPDAMAATLCRISAAHAASASGSAGPSRLAKISTASSARASASSRRASARTA